MEEDNKSSGYYFDFARALPWGSISLGVLIWAFVNDIGKEPQYFILAWIIYVLYLGVRKRGE